MVDFATWCFEENQEEYDTIIAAGHSNRIRNTYTEVHIPWVVYIALVKFFT